MNKTTDARNSEWIECFPKIKRLRNFGSNINFELMPRRLLGRTRVTAELNSLCLYWNKELITLQEISQVNPVSTDAPPHPFLSADGSLCSCVQHVWPSVGTGTGRGWARLSACAVRVEQRHQPDASCPRFQACPERSAHIPLPSWAAALSTVAVYATRQHDLQNLYQHVKYSCLL